MDDVNNELVLVSKVYPINEIKLKIKDIMDNYGIEKAYLFGSYARGEATIDSDIDIMIKIRDNDDSFGLIKLSSLENDLMKALGKEVDVIIEGTYTDEIQYDGENIKQAKEIFYSNVRKDMVEIYG